MDAFFPLETTGRIELYTIHPKSGQGRSLTYQVVFLSPELERTLEFGRGNRLRFSGELEPGSPTLRLRSRRGLPEVGG